jgi:hypothetical protein
MIRADEREFVRPRAFRRERPGITLVKLLWNGTYSFHGNDSEEIDEYGRLEETQKKKC